MGRAAAITEIEYEEQQRDIIRVVSARTLELWSLLRACRSGASFCFEGAKLARFCVPGLRQARRGRKAGFQLDCTTSEQPFRLLVRLTLTIAFDCR